jgi:hypothetical protein
MRRTLLWAVLAGMLVVPPTATAAVDTPPELRIRPYLAVLHNPHGQVALTVQFNARHDGRHPATRLAATVRGQVIRMRRMGRHDPVWQGIAVLRSRPRVGSIYRVQLRACNARGCIRRSYALFVHDRF